MELLAMDRWSMAMCVVLSLVFLMRPGDWKTVRVERLVPPAVGGSRRTKTPPWPRSWNMPDHATHPPEREAEGGRDGPQRARDGARPVPETARGTGLSRGISYQILTKKPIKLKLS